MVDSRHRPVSAFVMVLALWACAEKRAQQPTVASQQRWRPTRVPVPPAARPTLPSDHFQGVSVVALPWHRRIELLTDRRRFGRAFARGRYWPPEGALLMAARVFRGVGQPSFEYYSLGDTGFRYSLGEWVPASSVKLATTVGALYSLNRRGLSGAAIVRLRDPDGTYDGPVDALYEDALLHSSNLGYNRLMMIAGFDAINHDVLTPRFGLPSMTLQSRYGSLLRGTSLRRSPEIAYREGDRRGVIAARQGRARFARCNRVANCVTFFELQEVLRRVMLHDALPKSARFPIYRRDVEKIHALLLKARDRFHRGLHEALGHDVAIYNNVGRIPGQDLLENGFIVDNVTGDRYLVAVLVPFEARDDPKLQVEKRLAELARHALEELRLAKALSNTPLQLDAGAAMRVRARVDSRLALRIHAEGADGVRVWFDRHRLPATERLGDAFIVFGPRPEAGEHLLVLQALRRGKAIGYRSVGLRVAAASGTSHRERR